MNLVSWTLGFDFRAPYWQCEAVSPGLQFPVHGLGLGYPSLRYAAVIGASSPVHAPASALLSDWTMRTVHQQNILVVMTTHGQLNFSLICPSWKFYFLRHYYLTLKILSFCGGGGGWILSKPPNIQDSWAYSVNPSAICWHKCLKHWKKLCRMLGISSPRIWVLLTSNGYKWLIVSTLCFLLKYIRRKKQQLNRSVFFMVFK